MNTSHHTYLTLLLLFKLLSPSEGLAGSTKINANKIIEVRNFIRLEMETRTSSAAGETKSWA